MYISLSGYRVIIVKKKILTLAPTNGDILTGGLSAELRTSFNNFYEAHGTIDQKSFVILVPAYNEEDSIKLVIKKIPPQIQGRSTQTIVINDGSTDRTSKVALADGANVLEMPKNSGQGAALKAGYLLALENNVEYIGVVDADDQWDPSDFEYLLKPLLKNEATFSQGSRKLGSTEVGDPIRDLGVEVFTRLISFLLKTNVGDTSSGIRCYNSKVLKNVRLEQRQYQSSEILISALCNGEVLYEHPVKMSKRAAGVSKKAPNFRYGLYYLKAVLRTVIRDKYLAKLIASGK